MNDDFDEVKKLIGLKRYEQPPEHFVEDFLAEFHHRQRQELLKRSSISLFWERVITYFEGWSAPSWGAAGAAAMAFVASLLWISASGEPEVGGINSSGMVPASYEKPYQDLSVAPLINFEDERARLKQQLPKVPVEGEPAGQPSKEKSFSAQPLIQGPSDR